MTWPWKKLGITLPEQQAKRLDDLVIRLYGKRNKGMRKYLYTLAIRELLQLDDDVIKHRVHQLQGFEQGVKTNNQSA